VKPAEPQAKKPGRPRADIDLAQELFEARRAARLALRVGAGGPVEVKQASFGLLSRMSNDDQARLNRWFPLMKRGDGQNVWDLNILESILRWDDPVVMLKTLAADDPGAWAAVFREAEKTPCSKDLEDIIRIAFDKVRRRFVHIPDRLAQDFQVFSENDSLRLK